MLPGTSCGLGLPASPSPGNRTPAGGSNIIRRDRLARGIIAVGTTFDMSSSPIILSRFFSSANLCLRSGSDSPLPGAAPVGELEEIHRSDAVHAVALVAGSDP